MGLVAAHTERCFGGASCALCEHQRELVVRLKERRKAGLPPEARSSHCAAAPAPAATSARATPNAQPVKVLSHGRKKGTRGWSSTDPPNDLGYALKRSVESAATESAARIARARTATRLTQAEYRAIMRDLQQRELTPEDYDLLLRLDEIVEKRDVLTARDAFSLATLHPAGSDGAECVICLGEVPAGETIAELACGHVYHPECIREWLTKSKDTCPMCGCTCRK